jgi:4-hydroxyacetophenone monooxygenase
VAAVPHIVEKRGFSGEVALLDNPPDVALLQSKAADFLKSYRDAGAGPMEGDPRRLRRGIELAAGSPIPDAEIEMWLEQLAVDPMARGYDWPELPPVDACDGFTVAVIGGGMGGLNAAVHLKKAGINFMLIEKNAEVGGTWYENRYPGARLDTTSRSYFHCFGVNYPCPAPFSVQAHNGRYMKWVADHFDLRGNIVFNTEVDSLIWVEQAKLWEIKAHGPDGTRSWRVNAVISAVGLLNRPNIPAIEGIDSFDGIKLHTAK